MRHYTAFATVAALALVGGGAVAITPAYGAAELCQGRPATIAATAQSQTLEGTDGPDVISAGGFAGVTINANAGDDVVCLGDGGYAFTVHGGDGNDSIEGVGELYGEAGDDALTLLPTTANSGATLDGGPGDDVLDASREPNPNHPLSSGQRLLPGPGNDTITGTKAAQVSFAGASGVTISVPDGTVVGEGSDTISGISDFVGSPGHDTFRGSSEPEHWQGDPADDVRGATDVVDGAGGDDELRGSGRLLGGDGADMIHLLGAGGLVAGGQGDDVLIDVSAPKGPLRGAATYRGGAGDDRIEVVLPFAKPRGARYRLLGGGGDDRIRIMFLSTQKPCRSAGCSDLINGGSGTDQVAFGYERTRVNLVTGRATYEGGSRGILRGIEDVAGSLGNDVLIGNAGPNVLRGRYGNDILIGGGGRDHARGGRSTDTCRAEVTAGCER